MFLPRAPIQFVAVVLLSILGMTAHAQPVVINELHYHPSEIVDPGQTLEFLELHNPGVAAVDLSGWTICDGVTFTFPNGANIAAGGYVVVALNPTALLNASGHLTPYQWTPGVNLSNGGERVALCNNVSALIDEVTYDDASPWPVEPDGNGPTLELLNPSLNNALGTSWRRSVNAVGTPGAVNSGFDSGPSLIAISPARRTAVGALSSVTVTFDRAVNGVTADDLTVNGSPASMLTGTAGTAGPYEFSGFAAPSPGSTAIQLLAGGITDGQNVPFAGDSWTVSVGQHIILNEINYHPHSSIVDEATEFVELHNAGANDVNLGHWSFVDGITFEFPPDTIIAAGAYHVVAYSPADLQSATGYAGASAWSDGRLANSGERLTIVDGEQNVIDQVTYSDKGVWSSLADGSGPSLELINPHLPNQYGSAWLASVANHGTPGAQNSRFNAAPAPIIAGTLHSPAIPPPLADVTITTTVIDDVVANPTVELHYRQDQNPTIAYTSVSMFDDGLHGDGAAGDNIFGAVVAGLPDGQRLDFYITASDGVTTSTAPHRRSCRARRPITTPRSSTAPGRFTTTRASASAVPAA